MEFVDRAVRKNRFTLVEIAICVAILGFASITIGWQIRAMIANQQFSNSVDHLYTDLKRCQLIAACDRTDIELHIFKDEGNYFYRIKSDDPLPSFIPGQVKLTGVMAINKGNKPVDSIKIRFFPSGSFDPIRLSLFQDSERSLILNLEPSIIKKERKCA